MGMSSYANHVNTVSEDVIKKVCRKELMLFQKALTQSGIDLDTWAEALDTENTGEYPIAVYTYFEKLTSAFRKNTKLILALGYHDPGMSFRGDDISGGFWEVGNVRDYTPAAKSFLKKYGNGAIADSFFCTYG